MKMTSDKKIQDKRGSSKVEQKRSSLESQLEATYCKKVGGNNMNDTLNPKKQNKQVRQVENKFRSTKESIDVRDLDSKTAAIV